MICFPEPSDRVYFYMAIARFDAGERVSFPSDRTYFRMQTVLGQHFDSAFLGNPSVFSLFPTLDRDYQQVFALYWEMRMDE